MLSRMPPDTIPRLSPRTEPPLVLGTAALTHEAMAGAGLPDLLALIARTSTAPAARAYDTSIAYQLAFRRAEGLDLQDETLAEAPLLRIRQQPDQTPSIKLLALCTPGDLMVNTPLDFITRFLDVRLDLLFLSADQPLPGEMPDHDLAFIATSEADPVLLARLARLIAAWPRPVLNHPRHLPRLVRDTISAALRGVSGIYSPGCAAIERARLDDHIASNAPLTRLPPGAGGPVLIRPHGSHAGAGLRLIESNGALRDYLLFAFAPRYFVTEFVDYRGPDGLFRKYRVAFIGGTPHLCHMAVSQHWMVHYLNAGMTESADKRAEEARAMAEFPTGFARRHASALAALQEMAGFDVWSIDCAETPDGQLLVFEADTAAIIHLMDPADLFAYKHEHMPRVFDAFAALLRRRITDAYAPSDLVM